MPNIKVTLKSGYVFEIEDRGAPPFRFARMTLFTMRGLLRGLVAGLTA